jgi:hypothetical protein
LASPHGRTTIPLPPLGGEEQRMRVIIEYCVV